MLAVLLVLAAGTACGSASLPSRECGPVLSAQECAVFGADVEPREDGSWGLDRMEVVEASGSGAPSAVRVSYPEGSSSPESHREHGSPLGGAQVYLPLRAGGAPEVWLSYAVRFEEGFDFARGGKLPGLYGGTRTSGGNTPDGTDGLSTRLMWRPGGAGEVYAYLPSSEDRGTSLGRGSWTFETGRWVQVEQHVRLNEPGEEDGEIRLSIDGEEVLAETGVVFRTTDELLVEGIFFSSFFGGSDRSWASPRDQHADFAGFRVSTAPPQDDAA